MAFDNQYPILDFDADKEALINPSHVFEPIDGIECGVLCFFGDEIERFRERNDVCVLAQDDWEDGMHYIYGVERSGRHIAVAHPGVGASLATGSLEWLIEIGCTKILVCGGAGALNKELAAGGLQVPDEAVRDEGTSYHYLKPGHPARPGKRARQALTEALREKQIAFAEGKCWTTDGFFRETTGKAEARFAQGCLSVEMEAAALFAAAEFRGIELAQLIYFGDLVVREGWDRRGWRDSQSVRAAIFDLCLEAVLRI